MSNRIGPASPDANRPPHTEKTSKTAPGEHKRIEEVSEVDEEQKRRKFQKSMEEIEENDLGETKDRLPNPFQTDFHLANRPISKLKKEMKSAEDKAIPSPLYSTSPPDDLSKKKMGDEKEEALPQSDEFWKEIDEPPDHPIPTKNFQEQLDSKNRASMDVPGKMTQKKGTLDGEEILSDREVKMEPRKHPRLEESLPKGALDEKGRPTDHEMKMEPRKHPRSEESLPKGALDEKGIPTDHEMKKEPRKHSHLEESLPIDKKGKRGAPQPQWEEESEMGIDAKTPLRAESGIKEIKSDESQERKNKSRSWESERPTEESNEEFPKETQLSRTTSFSKERNPEPSPGMHVAEGPSFKEEIRRKEGELPPLPTIRSLAQGAGEEIEKKEIPLPRSLRQKDGSEEEKAILNIKEEKRERDARVMEWREREREGEKRKKNEAIPMNLTPVIPIEAVPFATTAVNQVAHYLNPETYALFYQMVGSIFMLRAIRGITKTEILLNSPAFAKSKFYGSTITIEKYETAPDSLNIRLIGTDEAVSAFNENLPSLMNAFKKGGFSFRIGRIEAEYETNRSDKE